MHEPKFQPGVKGMSKQTHSFFHLHCLKNLIMMALFRTPIPPDPGCESTCSFYSGPNYSQAISRGRIRPEGTDIAVMHQKGSLGHLLLSNPVLPQRRFKYTVPKNHHKENVKRIRQIQAQSKKKELESQGSVTVLSKSTKYDNVLSKVKSCQKACDKPASVIDEHSHTLVKSKKNFLSVNIESAAKTKIKRPPSQHQATSVTSCDRELSKYKRGVVPDYLQERKEQWRKAEEQRKASLPDPSIPDGHTLMPENERRNTLSILQENLSVLETELQALPLHSDTLRVQKRKAELQVKFSEVEDAIKIFSKPKVFIKVDE